MVVLACSLVSEWRLRQAVSHDHVLNIPYETDWDLEMIRAFAPLYALSQAGSAVLCWRRQLS